VIIKRKMEQQHNPVGGEDGSQGKPRPLPAEGQGSADWPDRQVLAARTASALAKVIPTTITPEEREAFPESRLEAILAELPPGLVDSYLDKVHGRPELPETEEITRRARAVRFLAEFLGVSAPPLDEEALAADHDRMMAEFRAQLPEILERRRAALGEEPEPPSATS